MAKIRAYTGYSERRKTHYYTDFEIVNKLPEVGEVVYGDDDNCININYGERERVKSVSAVSLDCEQGNDEVYNYDYYEVCTQFEEYDEESKTFSVADEDYSIYYYAIKREDIDD